VPPDPGLDPASAAADSTSGGSGRSRALLTLGGGRRRSSAALLRGLARSGRPSSLFAAVTRVGAGCPPGTLPHADAHGVNAGGAPRSAVPGTLADPDPSLALHNPLHGARAPSCLGAAELGAAEAVLGPGIPTGVAALQLTSELAPGPVRGDARGRSGVASPACGPGALPGACAEPAGHCHLPGEAGAEAATGTTVVAVSGARAVSAHPDLDRSGAAPGSGWARRSGSACSSTSTAVQDCAAGGVCVRSTGAAPGLPGAWASVAGGSLGAGAILDLGAGSGTHSVPHDATAGHGCGVDVRSEAAGATQEPSARSPAAEGAGEQRGALAQASRAACGEGAAEQGECTVSSDGAPGSCSSCSAAPAAPGQAAHAAAGVHLSGMASCSRGAAVASLLPEPNEPPAHAALPGELPCDARASSSCSEGLGGVGLGSPAAAADDAWTDLAAAARRTTSASDADAWVDLAPAAAESAPGARDAGALRDLVEAVGANGAPAHGAGGGRAACGAAGAWAEGVDAWTELAALSSSGSSGSGAGGRDADLGAPSPAAPSGLAAAHASAQGACAAADRRGAPCREGADAHVQLSHASLGSAPAGGSERAGASVHAAPGTDPERVAGVADGANAGLALECTLPAAPHDCGGLNVHGALMGLPLPRPERGPERGAAAPRTAPAGSRAGARTARTPDTRDPDAGPSARARWASLDDLPLARQPLPRSQPAACEAGASAAAGARHSSTAGADAHGAPHRPGCLADAGPASERTPGAPPCAAGGGGGACAEVPEHAGESGDRITAEATSARPVVRAMGGRARASSAASTASAGSRYAGHEEAEAALGELPAPAPCPHRPAGSWAGRAGAPSGAERACEAAPHLPAEAGAAGCAAQPASGRAEASALVYDPILGVFFDTASGQLVGAEALPVGGAGAGEGT